MSDVSREKRIHFNALPVDVRKGLKANFEGTGSPGPIISDQASLGWDLAGWITLLTLGLGIVGIMGWWGFGDTWDEWAVQGVFFVPVYLTGFFLLFWSVLRMFRRMQLDNRTPYPLGRYLLPGDFIDATTEELRIIPMGDLVDFNGTHHHTNGAYTHTELNFIFVGGKVEQFTIHGRDLAEQVLNEVGAKGRILSAAAQNADIGVLAEMDPLLEARMSEQWEGLDGKGAPAFAPKVGPVTGSVAAPLRMAATLALVAALLVGLPFQLVRNLLSDEAMYADLQQTTSTWECERYLDNGWRHTDEVMTELLPGAAFRDAQQQGSVAAMRGFLKEYPGTRWEPEARSMMHTYYQDALAGFQKHATTDNPEAVPFMTDLLLWLETHDDPSVDVRFMPPANGALDLVDEMINDPDEPLWDGPIAPVSKNFSDAKSKAREGSITRMLQEGFGQVFSNDVLILEEGARLTSEEWEKPVGKPTILVSYAVNPSGDVYTSEDSDRAYVGIVVDFFVEMKVPESDNMLDLELSVEPPQVFSVGNSYLSYLVNSDPKNSSDDANVYDTMALRAFDHLGTGVRRAVFKEGVGDITAPGSRPSSGSGLGGLGLDGLGGEGGMSIEEMEALLKMIEEGNY